MKLSRFPAVAGMFYSASSNRLEEEVDFYMSSAGNLIPGFNVHGLVVPHAGYMYSGKTAAYAYNTVTGCNYKSVIVLSPSHSEYFQGICVYKGDEYITPLGSIAVNRELRDLLVKSSDLIFSGVKGHQAEHAIEVQLPFLQRSLKNFDIVPLVMGDQNELAVNELADQLRKIASPDILIVASSDLSHYYSRPKAQILDRRAAELISNYDYSGLMQALSQSACEACGGGLIAALMRALRPPDNRMIKTLFQCDSGDVSGDTDEVVGYLSAAVFSE